MTIAFVLQTYRDPDQIERLVDVLVTGTADRLIVVSHSGSETERHRLATHKGIDRVLPSPGGRGTFGVIDGLISSMRWLERQDKPYEWLVVLSGQDYPIRPLGELEAELAASAYDGYFHHFDVTDARDLAAPPMRWRPEDAEERYLFQYMMLNPNPTKLQRALLKVPRLTLARSRRIRLHTSMGLMLGRRPKTSPFTDAFKLYGGSYWMTIRRKAVSAVLSFVDDRGDIVGYFRSVIAPEEAFLQTILANDPSLRLSKQELRFYEFANGRHGYAAVLGMGDLARLTASGCYFARKFDPNHDAAVLDALDRIVLAARPDPAQAAPPATIDDCCGSGEAVTMAPSPLQVSR